MSVYIYIHIERERVAADAATTTTMPLAQNVPWNDGGSENFKIAKSFCQHKSGVEDANRSTPEVAGSLAGSSRSVSCGTFQFKLLAAQRESQALKNLTAEGWLAEELAQFFSAVPGDCSVSE